MEQGPKIRVIGAASPEKKEGARTIIEHSFADHNNSISQTDRELLEKFEQKKSDKEIASANFANEETFRLMQEAGVEPYEVPLENLHILPPETYEKLAGSKKGGAITFSDIQGIFFNVENFADKPVVFGLTAFHELMHLKGHLTIELQENDGKTMRTQYRDGLAVRSLQRHSSNREYHSHFEGLDEAIVAEAEKRFANKLLDVPEFASEKEWLFSNEAKELKKKISLKAQIPEEDILWVGKNGENDWEYASYFQHRNVLNYVCKEIQKEFPEKFLTQDDVYKVFLNANFTGKLLEIARLVERTFGGGSFRVLGNMGTDPSSAVLHLETLKKARVRQIKAK